MNYVAPYIEPCGEHDLSVDHFSDGWRFLVFDDEGAEIYCSSLFASEDDCEREGRACYPEARFIGEEFGRG